MSTFRPHPQQHLHSPCTDHISSADHTLFHAHTLQAMPTVTTPTTPPRPVIQTMPTRGPRPTRPHWHLSLITQRPCPSTQRPCPHQATQLTYNSRSHRNKWVQSRSRCPPGKSPGSLRYNSLGKALAGGSPSPAHSVGGRRRGAAPGEGSRGETGGCIEDHACLVVFQPFPPVLTEC